MHVRMKSWCDWASTPPLASTSKYLAQINKTPDRRRRYHERCGPNAMQSGEGRTRRFAPLCQLALAVNGWGLFHPNMQMIANPMGFFWPRCIFWTTAEV